MDTYQAGNDNTVRSWASIIDSGTIDQAARTARSEVVTGPLALMPDAHIGMGATIGSVIPTQSAIIPSAVGVDVGCGMSAVETVFTSEELPDDLDSWLASIGKIIPAGLGKWHGDISKRAWTWLNANPIPDLAGNLETKMHERAGFQLGTLGGGNHFVEVGVDEHNKVWLILHSGSRGIGNKLAVGHIRTAKTLAKNLERRIEDRDLSYFLESDDEFNHYLADMLWSQRYAWENREIMMDGLLRLVAESMPKVKGSIEEGRINCHHNYTCREKHDDQFMWITRKGAINAEVGTLGVIPGSMGTSTFIVEGLGNPLSYNSAAHGSGRVLSRTAAKKAMSADDLKDQMANVPAWQSDNADRLIDEAPKAYKDIHTVIRDMADLVRPIREIETVLNYKGF